MGAAITPWSPLGSGMLTGKYTRASVHAQGEGRLASLVRSENPGFAKLFTERNWDIVDTLVAVAREVGRSPAQVALNWVATRPGVGSTFLGASRLSQLEDNLQALDFALPEPLSRRLEEASRPELVHPYHFITTDFFLGGMLTGGTRVRQEPGWFRPAR